MWRACWALGCCIQGEIEHSGHCQHGQRLNGYGKLKAFFGDGMLGQLCAGLPNRAGACQRLQGLVTHMLVVQAIAHKAWDCAQQQYGQQAHRDFQLQRHAAM